MTIFFFFSVNVFLMDVYAEKNLLWSHLRKRVKETIFTIKYMLFIRREYIGTLSIYQKNVQWYNFVLTTEQPWVIWILKQIL